MPETVSVEHAIEIGKPSAECGWAIALISCMIVIVVATDISNGKRTTKVKWAYI